MTKSLTPPRPHKKRILSGIKPTSFYNLEIIVALLKIGSHYKRIRLFFSVVDLHSITVRHNPSELTENSFLAIATYLAAGLNPTQCTLFIQSHVPAHTQLSWMLNCHTYMGELSRMTQYKDKSAKEGTTIPAGLFTYSILMAADILLYQTNLVPVGHDQKQHIELTRDLAERMNQLYQKKLFTIPEPFIPPIGAKIMDLQNPDQKMSKTGDSDLGTLYLLDSDKEIEKKIKRATTDSGSDITYSDDKPGVKNLLTIQSVLTGTSPEDLVKSYQGKQYGHLKGDTADIVIQSIRPIEKSIHSYLKDKGELQKILKKGAAHASQIAQETLQEVSRSIGFIDP